MDCIDEQWKLCSQNVSFLYWKQKRDILMKRAQNILFMLQSNQTTLNTAQQELQNLNSNKLNTNKRKSHLYKTLHQMELNSGHDENYPQTTAATQGCSHRTPKLQDCQLQLKWTNCRRCKHYWNPAGRFYIIYFLLCVWARNSVCMCVYIRHEYLEDIFVCIEVNECTTFSL